eukprot:SAG31_NODE_7227_length_1749_cov_1.548485_1_plen_50_part_00
MPHYRAKNKTNINGLLLKDFSPATYIGVARLADADGDDDDDDDGVLLTL